MQNAPWYRHIWVWLIMIPPFAAVVGGVTTVVIAARGADEVIRDDYYKIGLQTFEDTSRRDAAEALGLGANVFFVRADGQVTVVLRDPQQVAGDSLTLRLVHPTDSRHDREAPLLRTGGSFQAKLDQAINGRWGIHIEPEDQAWRLAGEMDAEASAVSLGKGP